jgi:hypothetical protein
VSGTKILVQNRQLLWFSLLTGVILTLVFIAQYGLRLLTVYPYVAIDFPRWIVLTFIIVLLTVFSLNILLAGLVQSLSQGEGDRPASFHEGLFRTKGHLHTLADWSVILALCGTALSVPLIYFEFATITLRPIVSLFPFNFIFLPEVYHIGPIGGTFTMSSAVTSTLIITGISIFFYSS